MRPISARSLKFLRALERERSLVEKLTGGSADDLTSLSELLASAEIGLVPHLLPLVLEGGSAVSKAAAHVLTASIATASAAELIELDERSRAPIYAQSVVFGGLTVRPSDVARFSDYGDDECAVIGLLSFHFSGWVREAAITRLDALTTGRELRS